MNDLEPWFFIAAEQARKSLCLRSSCGAIIVRDSVVLGSGYNGPPRDDLRHRVCTTTAPSLKKPKSDRTCCLHAEWRALWAAGRDLAGATLIFVRVDGNGSIKRSGKPYCTVCSRIALDSGIDSWALWHADGIRRYPADEYHRLSQLYDSLAG